MTLQEARQQLNACERRITGTYSNLRDAARSVGANAAQAASSNTTISTMWPLIISILGLILCFVSSRVWGILFIIVGIVVAYKTHKSAKFAQTTIENQQKNLNAIIENNVKI